MGFRVWLEGEVGVEGNQPNTKNTACGRVFMFGWSVEGGREVGEGRLGRGGWVLKYIYNVITKKQNLL